MYIVPMIVTHSQAAKLMKPTDGPFYHPTKDSQAASVGSAPFGQLRVDSSFTQLGSLRFRVKAAVTGDSVRTLARMPWLAGDGRHSVDHEDRLLGIRQVRRCYDDHERDALSIRQQAVFTAFLGSIDGAGACFVATTDGAHVSRVDNETRKIYLVSPAQFSQQDLVDGVPHSSRLPFLQTIPTGHATTTAHLLGQVFPRDSGPENKDNPRKNLAIIEKGTATVWMSRVRGKQRLDEFPQVVGKKWSGHDDTAAAGTSWQKTSNSPSTIIGAAAAQEQGYFRGSNVP
jgi:hypothetical protein